MEGVREDAPPATLAGIDPPPGSKPEKNGAMADSEHEELSASQLSASQSQLSTSQQQELDSASLPANGQVDDISTANKKGKRVRKKKKKKRSGMATSRSAASLLRTGRGQKRQRAAAPTRSSLGNLRREKIRPFPGGVREIKSSVGGIEIVRADRGAGLMKLSQSVPSLHVARRREPSFADLRDGMGGARVLGSAGKAGVVGSSASRMSAKRGLGASASEGKVAWDRRDQELEQDEDEVKESAESKAKDPFAAKRKRLFTKSQSGAARELFAGLGVEIEKSVEKEESAVGLTGSLEDSKEAENQKIHDSDFLRLDQSKMPLEKFDFATDKGEEDPEDLLRASKTGRSPFWDGQRWSWRPCRVLSYDRDSKRFAIEFSGVSAWAR